MLRAERRTDMKKLLIAFRNFVNASRNYTIWNAGTTRDIAHGSKNPLHKPVATSEKSP